MLFKYHILFIYSRPPYFVYYLGSWVVVLLVCLNSLRTPNVRACHRVSATVKCNRLCYPCRYYLVSHWPGRFLVACTLII